MNIDKSKKRIAKRVKMGFQGYPEIAIAYSGHSGNLAEEVIVTFIAEDGSAPIEEARRSRGRRYPVCNSKNDRTL